MLIINVYIVHLLCVGIIIYFYWKKGLSYIFPIYMFCMIFFPGNVQIKLPGLFDLTIQRVLTIVILILVLISKREEIFQKKNELKYLIILLIVWIGLSNIYSIVPIVSLKKMLAYIFEYFTIYFIFVKYVNDTVTIRKVLISIHLAVVLASVLGVVEYINRWSFINVFPTGSGRFGDIDRTISARSTRIKSVFPHPILFGSAIAMTLPITFHLLVNSKKRVIDAALWVSIYIMIFCLWKTVSRGPWIAAALAMIIVFIFYGAVRKYLLIIAASMVLAMVIRPGIFVSLKHIAFATFDPTTPLGGSYEYRYVLYKLVQQALDESTLRFLLGYGQDSFFYLGLETEFRGFIYKFLSCDSSWAKILIESGYVGFILSVIIFGTAFISSIINYFKTPYPIKYNFIIYTSIMAAVYFLMTNVAIYGWGQNSYILWVVIAFTYAHRNLYNTYKNLNEYKRKKLIQKLQNENNNNISDQK